SRPAGDSTQNGGTLVANAAGQPVGQNALNANGADYTATFQVNGIAEVVGATTTDDTLATAQQLGDITAAGIVQIQGAIGNDPTDPNPHSTGGANPHEFHIRRAPPSPS